MPTTARALAQFTSQLSMLQEAGFPLLRSLRMLEAPMRHGPLKVALVDVIARVEEGSSFSDALARHPRVFDALYVGAARGGEVAGALDRTLEQLARYLMLRQRLTWRVVGALLYPTVQLVVTVVILAGFLTQVVPSFEQIFTDIGADLPLPTVMMLNLSELVSNHWPWLLGLPVVAAVVHELVVSSSGGRWARDVLVLRLPLIGRLVRRAAIGRYLRSLATMIEAGVPLLRALEICVEQARNTRVRQAGQEILASVADGDTLSAPLERSGLADPITVRMIEVGEESGTVDQMLHKVAQDCEDEVAAMAYGMATLAQPLMIAMTGVFIGAVVVSMFLPFIAIVEVL